MFTMPAWMRSRMPLEGTQRMYSLASDKVCACVRVLGVGVHDHISGVCIVLVCCAGGGGGQCAYSGKEREERVGESVYRGS